MSADHPFSIDYEITPEDTEQPYAHVHHAHALRLLERARLAYLEAIGYPLERYLAQGIFLVIGSISIDYKRELRVGAVTITAERPRRDRRAIVLDQRILNARGKVAVEATVSSLFMSAERRRAMHPPEDFMARFIAEA